MSNEAHKSWNPPGMVPAATLSTGPMEPVGFEASWELHRAEAERLDARDVKTFTPNATVVLHNVRASVAAVVAERAWFEAQADAPRVDFARVAATETAAEALVFTAARARSVSREAPGVHGKIVRARKVLRILRGGAMALVEQGVLSAAELPRAEGTGPLAVAEDCLSYASLFRSKHAKTRGATAVSTALVREAATLGSELLREVKPKGVGTRGVRTEAEREASDARDRMGVVVTRAYDYIERVAAWRWGRAFEALVPPMASRALGRGEGGEEETVDGEDDASAEEGDDATAEAAREEGDDEDARAADDDAAEDEEEVAAVKEPAAPAKATPRKGPTAKAAVGKAKKK